MVCRNSYSILFTILTTMITTATAFATEAYTTASTWLRAGPDTSFISIERVPRDTLVDVYGCTNGYGWCDVDVDGERGWLPSSRLQFVYNGRRGPASVLAPLLGLMILQFSFRDYWDNHYQARPWYNEHNRQRWQNWQPQNVPPRHQSPQNLQVPITPQFNTPIAPQITPQLSPQIAPHLQPQVTPPNTPQASPQITPQLRPQSVPSAPSAPLNAAPSPQQPLQPQQQGQPSRPVERHQEDQQKAHGGPRKKACVPPEICN